MSLPSQEGASLELARGALQQGRFSEAIEYAAALTGADSANFGAWQILGAAHASAGNTPAAVDAFSQCTRLQPMAAPAHFNLAKALLAAGDKNRAQVELQSCLSLDPSYQKARQALDQLNPGSFRAAGAAAQPAAWGPPPPLGAGPTSSYSAGQVAAPLGAAPLGGQPAAPTSSYVQPTPFGQYGPPPGQPASYASSATLIGQRPAYGSPQAGLSSGTQAWSISGLVLGALCLFMYGLLTLGLMVKSAPDTGAITIIVMLNALTACLFIVGSGGTLARRNWGRSILMGAAVSAIVLLLLDLFMTFTGIGMPATMYQHSTAFQIGLHAGALFGDLGKICYCAFLLIHLKSDRVKDSMVG